MSCNYAERLKNALSTLREPKHHLIHSLIDAILWSNASEIAQDTFDLAVEIIRAPAPVAAEAIERFLDKIGGFVVPFEGEHSFTIRCFLYHPYNVADGENMDLLHGLLLVHGNYDVILPMGSLLAMQQLTGRRVDLSDGEALEKLDRELEDLSHDILLGDDETEITFADLTDFNDEFTHKTVVTGSSPPHKTKCWEDYATPEDYDWQHYEEDISEANTTMARACLALSKYLGPKREMVLKTMKHSRQASANVVREKGFLADIKAALEKSPYAPSSARIWRHADPRIHACRFGYSHPTPKADCRLFRAAISSEGLAYSMSVPSFEEIYQPTDYLNAFRREFETTPKDAQLGILRSHGGGDLYGVELVLRWSTEAISSRLIANLKDGRVSIHNPWEPADLSRHVVFVKPGYTYNIEV